MIKRGQVFVRAKKKDGRWDAIDALDLDDESFRAFVLGHLVNLGAVFAMNDEVVEGEKIELRERLTHTPGPLHVSSSFLVVTAEARIVARCQPFELPELAIPAKECVANAHLFAAAPDLLLACKDAAASLSGLAPEGWAIHEILRYVIRKAEGK